MSGYIDAILYVLIASITFVLLTKISSGIDPVISLFFLSGVAILSFNLLGINKISETYKAFKNNWVLCISMSIALGLDWVFMLFASIRSDPFVAMGSIFVTLAILGFLKLFRENRNYSNFISILLLISSLLLMGLFYKTGSVSKTLLGMIFGSLAGISFYFYMIFSSKLINNTNLSSIQILSLRFWALFIGSLFFLPKSSMVIILDKYVELTVISILSLVIPIFFNQQALQKLGPGIASVFFCFVPPVTYLFYAIYNRHYIPLNVIICIIITIALVFPKALFFINKSRR